MRNYQLVEQWAAGLNSDKAYNEIVKLMERYPWLKCDESYKLICELYVDIPKIINIIRDQEKQNAIHREFVRVSRMADDAIVRAVAEKVGITL